MKAFISGGAGVIGKELVSRLLSQGHKVIVGDLQPRPQELGEGVEYLHGDLNDLKTWPECDVFYHLAATFERLEESPEHWEKNFRHNVQLSHHLLTLCKAPRVVFASSYLVYDKHTDGIRRPIAPRNLTAAAKFYTETEMSRLHPNSVSARIYRSYGKGSKDIISRWCRDRRAGKRLQVFGGLNLLDFIYAGDVADGLILLAKSKYRGAIDLGTGTPTSIVEVVRMISKDVDFILEPCDYECGVADSAHLVRELGWKPGTSIQLGIQHILQYEEAKARCGQ
jgi:carbamoyl-phosphate synthase large subunit